MSASNADAVLDDVRSLDDLYGLLPGMNLEPLWTMSGALTKEPATKMVPCLWPYEEARAALLVAGGLISAEDADRRVLAFKNPGTGDDEVARSTDMLWAALQMVLPGEIAPPHRHTPAALRFVVEGSGAYTVVDGRRCPLEHGDVCITPSWSWHEHGHAGKGPMLWLDGLDLPLISTLRLGFAEFGGGVGESPEDSDTSDSALINHRLTPSWTGVPEQPMILWTLADVEVAFAQLAATAGDPCDDLILEYTHPGQDGPLMRTIGAHVQMLRNGTETRPHRHTHSAVYHVVRGEGRSVVDGVALNWKERDTFAVPTWAEHSHQQLGDGDAVLFSFTDAPIVRALGLEREARR